MRKDNRCETTWRHCKSWPGLVIHNQICFGVTLFWNRGSRNSRCWFGGASGRWQISALRLYWLFAASGSYSTALTASGDGCNNVDWEEDLKTTFWVFGSRSASSYWVHGGSHSSVMLETKARQAMGALNPDFKEWHNWGMFRNISILFQSVWRYHSFIWLFT